MSVGLLTVLSRGDKILYVVPMLILTLADAIAALVGIAYGRIRYLTTDGLKSAEGSIAFLVMAFLSVHVPLLLFTDIGRAQTLLISALIAILSMLIEAISARGLDNLLIPLGAFAFLRLYENATVHALALRLIAASVLVVFVLCWRGRSTLDDSALIACALFGYGAAMLGGAAWLTGPTILFLVHLALWPRFGQRRGHTVYAVASVTLAGLLWLVLQAAYGGVTRFFFPYAVGFGAHLAIIGVSRIAVDPSPRPRQLRLFGSVLLGWVTTVIQIIPLLAHTTRTTPLDATGLVAIAGLSVALAATSFYAMLPFLYGPKGSDAAIHSAGFTSALLASILAGGFHHVFVASP
jgi:phytol kinase